MRYESELSNNAKIVVRNSKNLACRCNEQQVNILQLFWALTTVENSFACEILNAFNINKNSMLSAMKQIYPNMTNTNAVVDIDFTPQVKRVLQLSLDIAYSQSTEYITTEYILFAIMSDKTNNAVYRLLEEKFNIIPEMLLQSTFVAIKTGEIVLPQNMNSNQKKYEQNNGELNKKSVEDINSALPESLRDMGIDLTMRAKLGKMDPIIGRDKETSRIIEILCRKTKNNPVLIGEAGVGKSAVIEGLAQSIVKGDVPELLKDKIIFSLEIGSLMAGTKYRGSMEEKLKRAINDIRNAKNIIVFIDEIHTLAQAGGHDDEVSPADILKPYLARGEMQTIGATTTDEYRKYIEKDKALERRFQPIMVDEPSVEDAIKILRGVKDSYEAFHKVKIKDEAIVAAVNLSVRYIMDRYLPDKAIDLIDEASSRAKVQGSVLPEEIRKVQKELKETEMRKSECDKLNDYTLSQQWNEKITALKGDIQVRLNAWNASRGNQTGIVGEEEIAEVVSKWTNIPVSKLTESEKQRLVNLEEELHKRVIGQEEAIKAVSKAIRRARAGLKDPNRPIGSFMFLGPTGVGKTELTKALAEVLFDDENAVIRVDMSEYMESHSISKLIGAPPGYVGFDNAGQLTEAVRKKPYSVVLFDEIEKAHPDVFNLLLQMLDDGRLTDSQGRTINFKNTVIIMTSNVGVADLPVNTKKLGFNESTSADINIKDRLMDSLKNKFRPEFLNRIDVIVIFDPLKPEEIRKIAEILISNLNKRLTVKNIKLEFTEKAKDELVKKGYNITYGARPLKRLIEQKIEDKLAEELLLGTIKENAKIIVDVNNDGFVFKN